MYKNCPLVIHDKEFSVDLIFGMDWLSKHRAIVECDQKTMALKCLDQSEVTMHGVRSGPLCKIISAIQAQQFLKKGYETFLASVLDSKRG